MKPGRVRSSPYRYDRSTIRYVVEREGVEAARARWPREVVDPIARAVGALTSYNRTRPALTREQIERLGTKPDNILAGEWGLPHSTVAHQRTLLGIPGCERTWRRRERLKRLQEIPDQALMAPLYELSVRLGIRARLLASERRRRGIKVSDRGASVIPDLDVRRCVALQALRAEFPGITLEELGAVFQLTRERIRQLEEQMTVERSA